MGYTLMIGEASLEKTEEYADISIYVKEIKKDDAPAYGEPTDYTNQRWPSYTSWHKFVQFFKLNEVFWDESTGLMRGHPFNSLITKEHKNSIDKAYSEFKTNNPTIKAKYNASDKEAFLVRLEWLKYWIDYAFDNCENPIFYNS